MNAATRRRSPAPGRRGSVAHDVSRPLVAPWWTLIAVAVLSAAAFGALEGCAPDGRPIDPAEAASRIDGHMRAHADSGFSGALLVGIGGEVVLAGGYGMASREASHPFTAETPSYIGSIVKQFTAAAVLRLEEEGRLSVQDTLGRFFPDAPADKRGITLHQVLTHTAALPEYGPGPDEEPLERDAMVAWILRSELDGAPGERFSYSNAGYTLLAAVVEITSGTPYEQYLRQRFFLPAGMTQTGSVAVGWREGEVAVGYAGGEPAGTPPAQRWMADGPSWNVRGAGGFVSTVGDLRRWAMALKDGAVLSAGAWKKMTTGHVPIDGRGPFREMQEGYGGVIATTHRGTRLFGVSGGDGAYNASLVHYLEEGVVIAMLSNTEEAPAERQLPAFDRILFGPADGEGPSAPPQPVVLEAGVLASYAGAYRLPSGGTLTVEPSGGGLHVRASGPDAVNAVALRRVRDAAAANRLMDRTEELLRSGAAGEMGPYRAVYFRKLSPEEVRQIRAKFFADPAAMLGAFRSLEAVGAVQSVVNEDAVEVLVEFRFERGSQTRRFGWIDGKVALNGQLENPSGELFRPVSDHEFVLFDADGGAARRIRFERGALVIPDPQGDVRAERPGSGAEK